MDVTYFIYRIEKGTSEKKKKKKKKIKKNTENNNFMKICHLRHKYAYCQERETL